MIHDNDAGKRRDDDWKDDRLAHRWRVETVAEFTDQFTQIVARNRADFYLYYRNQNAARAAAADFDNVMSDETYFRLERNSRLNQHLGIRNADFEIPEHYDLKKLGQL